MKRIIFATALVMIFTTATYARKVMEGKTFSTAGNYRIEKAADPVVLNGDELKTYTISYSNTPMNVTIAVLKSKGSKKYIVVSEKFSAQYVCNRSYFGIERLDRSFVKEELSNSDKNLNRTEFFRQKVLGRGGKNDREASRLIAAYFPFLINEFAEFTAFK